MTLADDMARTAQELRRGVIRERRLCCPRCGGKVELRTGKLRCVEPWKLPCTWTGSRLAELAEVDGG